MRSPAWVLVAALVISVSLGVAAAAQAPSVGTSKPAANAWLLIPTPYLEWNKDISPTLRSERDKVWDELGMSDIPLTLPGSMRVVGGSDDLTWDPREISDRVPNRAVLTATFTSHRSVLSSSERSLYTEIALHVDEVFDDRTGSGHPVANCNITLVVYGGTVILHNGQTLTVNSPAARPDLFIQPGRKYLLVLGYHSTGDFYGLSDSWDITDGTVRASSPRAADFAQAHHSILNGLPVGQLGQAVDKELNGDSER